MPLPGAASSGLTPEELSFLAENELVSIVPSYSIDSLNLISVESSPLPLHCFLALRSKCSGEPDLPSYIPVIPSRLATVPSILPLNSRFLSGLRGP